MLKYYTNVYREKGSLFVRGRDVYGKREQKVVRYKPYLYVPSPTPTEYKNLKGQHVAKMEFENIWEAQQFMKKYKDVANFSIFGYTKFEYNYISDNFRNLDYTFQGINIGSLDIEVVCRQGFPTAEKAEHPISVISVSKNNVVYVLATKNYTSKDPNVKFFLCKDEHTLLQKFLLLWEKLDLDIMTGWNINGFDIPYLINRIKNLFNWEEALKLSPWRKITSRETRTFMGHDKVEYTIAGISSLDYMEVYKKFCPYKRDSYTLNNICYIELQEKKVDYSEYESLNDLWDKNPEKYIDYNIHDTVLINKLEAKLKYIERSVAVAYDAKVNYEDALTSVLLWEVIIMNFLNKRNIVMPISKISGSRDRIEGAYVKKPQIELFDWVVSFDLTSLYPHILMGWNISPETLLGKQLTSVEAILKGDVNTEFLKQTDRTMAGNGCMYHKSTPGFIAELMEEQFNLRTQYKKKMLELKKEYAETKNETLKYEITKYDNYQYGKKIQLNSAYGAIANNYFLFYSRDNAEAVTYTGQVVIRWVEQRINVFLNEYFKTSGRDYVIASDTDSLYLNLGLFVSRSGIADKAKVLEALDKFSEEVMTPKFAEIFDELTDMMNCPTNKLHMKRENLIEKAIWRAKKNYAALVWDSEGVRYDKPELKIMGMEAVRSSTPEFCRNKFKEIVMTMFTEGEAAVQRKITEVRQEYMQLPVYDIARPTSVNDYTSYEQADGYAKGSGINVKAAILYNSMIDKLKLQDKYRYIEDGDKIKYLNLVKFNPIGDEVIGAPDGRFPHEFNIEQYVDRNFMFEKTFLHPIQSLLDGAGWSSVKQSTLENFFG